MMMAELLLDSHIRIWVFLPIVLISFLIGTVRHYVSIIFAPQNMAELQQIQDSQVLIRARILREHGKYLPLESFLMRRQFFNSEQAGYLKTKKHTAVFQNPMTDPSIMTDMLKGNATNVLPMIIIGGWINWMFSGFVASKVPFPLTLQFKSMLQRGIELQSLDAAWVSSASWYFLNVFGLRAIHGLMLSESCDVQVVEDQIYGAAMALPSDLKATFKAEWEALEICEHHWALINIEKEISLEACSH